MRLAIVGPYPPDGDMNRIHGGVEAVIVNMIKGLARFKGMDIHVITASTRVEAELDFMAGGAHIHAIPAPARFGNITLYSGVRKRIAARIRALDPDVVHSHTFGYYTLATFDSGHKKVIVSTHGMSNGMRSEKRGIVEIIRDSMQDYMYTACSKMVKNIIVNSPFARKTLGGLKNKIVYELDNPVSEAFFNLGNESEEDFRILFAGKICGQKGIMDILFSAKILRERVKNICFRIAGPFMDREFYSNAMRFVMKNRLEGIVNFLGPLDENALREEYRKACIFAFPSREDVAPVAVLEAMAAGKAIVASDTGGIPYIIEDGVNGFLIKTGDVNALTEKILLFIKDPGLRRRLGVMANIKASQHNRLDRVADKLRGIYEEVLNRC